MLCRLHSFIILWKILMCLFLQAINMVRFSLLSSVSPFVCGSKNLSFVHKALVMLVWVYLTHGFPGGSDSEESACSGGRPGFNALGRERSPGEGNGNPLQYSCLEDSMDPTIHVVAKNWTRLSTALLHAHTPSRWPWDLCGFRSRIRKSLL